MSTISTRRKADAEALIQRLIPLADKLPWEREYMEGCDGFFKLRLRKYIIDLEENWFTVRESDTDEIFQLEDYKSVRELFYAVKYSEDREYLDILEEIVKEVTA